MSTDNGFAVKSLGECEFQSPVADIAGDSDQTPEFVSDESQILYDDGLSSVINVNDVGQLATLELAGPREKLYFNPGETRVGIVTCGGLCPGLNDVIRGLVMVAYYRYGLRYIYGFRYGYRGFIPAYGHEVLRLEPEDVDDIHQEGGSVLGSSRGEQDTFAIVDCLQERKINILFTIGGDGTLRGSLDIAAEIERRGLKISVVGIPKTIDNDIANIDQSFGFETAYSTAVDAIVSAHNEAKGTLNGVGLVKLMGRHSGFLACHAALATSHVNIALIPEMPMGENFLEAFYGEVKKRLEKRKHVVVLVAEGAGQDLLEGDSSATDASGNAKLKDIGQFMADGLNGYLKESGMEFSLKYIDPSYTVRAVPAMPSDSVYCWQLAQNAVHAAMAGKTEMVVGKWHGRLVNIPTQMVIGQRKQVDPESELWLSVLETTGQPAVFE